MRDTIQQVRAFHTVFRLHIENTPTAQIPPDVAALRVRLLQEELDEYRAAVVTGDIVAVADALTDLAYVLFGTYVSHGLQDIADDLFAEVHRSNMSKLDAAGRPLYRADGKVVKSDQFTAPALEPIVRQAIAKRDQ